MKKIFFLFTLFICLIGIYIFVQNYKRPIDSIPHSQDIEYILIESNSNEVIKVSKGNELNKFLSLLNTSYSKIKDKKSVTDTPNVTPFYTIKIYKNNNLDPDIFLIYQRDNTVYLEQPYDLIYWTSTELLKEIETALIK